jgi:hypothetical protein
MEEYIKQHGLTDDELRDILEGEGWDAEDITEAAYSAYPDILWFDQYQLWLICDDLEVELYEKLYELSS